MVLKRIQAVVSVGRFEARVYRQSRRLGGRETLRSRDRLCYRLVGLVDLLAHLGQVEQSLRVPRVLVSALTPRASP